MQLYDIKMTQILCQSGEPNPYSGPFSYMPARPEDDEMLMA